MLRRASRLVKLLTALLVGAAVCGLLATAAVLGLSMPNAAQSLGPPGARVSPVEQYLLGAYLVLLEPQLDRPAGAPSATLELKVEPGETAASMIRRLEEAGVVDNGQLLSRYLRYRGLDVGIQAGSYFLSGGMTPRKIADVLQAAQPDEFVVTVLEGWRREQISDAVAKVGLPFSPDEFLEATETRPPFYSFTSELPNPPSLEGFLFPDTYRLDAETSALEFVLTLLDNFEERVDPSLQAEYRRQGLSVFEAVTLASIVEREAVVPDERPMIASVFLNRLAVGMKLDADPTVQYALGLQADGGWWKAPLSTQDLRVNSPYNTYLNSGLPPGPIANPGLSSLEAVAFPAESEFLYFRAACDESGRHLFALTFEEHKANACP